MINKNIGILYTNNNYYFLIKSVSHFSFERLVYDIIYYDIKTKQYGMSKLNYTYNIFEIIKKFELSELNNIDLEKFKNIIENILIFQ